MSDPLFDNKQQTPTPVAAQQTDLPDGSYVDALVGEGKKFSTLEEMAKGKFESDLYVTHLQGEMKGLRTVIDEQESVADLVDKAMQPQTPAPAEAPQAPAPAPSPEGSALAPLTPQDIQDLVTQQVNSRLSDQQKQTNVALCSAEAEKRYGTDFGIALAENARKLGVSQDFLGKVAEDQPAAFLKLMVEPTDGSTPPAQAAIGDPTPTGSLQIDAGAQSGVKNFAFYEKMRRADPKAYKSVAMQNEIYEASKAEGFYN
jgi:hypothetical protein